jgi:hypothetical protein
MKTTAVQFPIPNSDDVHMGGTHCTFPDWTYWPTRTVPWTPGIGPTVQPSTEPLKITAVEWPTKDARDDYIAHLEGEVAFLRDIVARVTKGAA